MPLKNGYFSPPGEMPDNPHKHWRFASQRFSSFPVISRPLADFPRTLRGLLSGIRRRNLSPHVTAGGDGGGPQAPAGRDDLGTARRPLRPPDNRVSDTARRLGWLERARRFCLGLAGATPKPCNTARPESDQRAPRPRSPARCAGPSPDDGHELVAGVS